VAWSHKGGSPPFASLCCSLVELMHTSSHTSLGCYPLRLVIWSHSEVGSKSAIIMKTHFWLLSLYYRHFHASRNLRVKRLVSKHSSPSQHPLRYNVLLLQVLSPSGSVFSYKKVSGMLGLVDLSGMRMTCMHFFTH
jgi:hypothetical protein